MNNEKLEIKISDNSGNGINGNGMSGNGYLDCIPSQDEFEKLINQVK